MIRRAIMGRSGQRYTFASIYGAVEPGTDNAFALILPEVSANAMQVYLDKFAETAAPDEHVLLVPGQAGWHEAKTLRAPAPRSGTQSYREGLAVLETEVPITASSNDAILDAATAAWNRMATETGRIASLCSYPWIISCVSS